MALRHKRSLPIDRSMRDLDRQIAAVQKQIRQITHQADRTGPVTARPGQVDSSKRSERVTKFMKEMLATTRRAGTPAHHKRTELFDGGREAIKELETPEPDLIGAKMATSAASSTNSTPGAQEKLAHYLSAGSIRTYRPLKHVQRKQRNRFFMWIGLSCAAFWLLYVVVR